MPRGSQSFLPHSEGEEGDEGKGRQSPTLNSDPTQKLMEGPAVQPASSLWQPPPRPPQLTQGLLALHTLVAPVLHAASPLFQWGAGSTPVPWLLQDMPLAETVRDLAGLDTATPAAPLCHDAGDRWKRRWRLQGQLLWNLGSGHVLSTFPTSRSPQNTTVSTRTSANLNPRVP